MNSNGSEEDNYTEENASYEMSQQVASPNAFAKAKQGNEARSQNKSASVIEDSAIKSDEDFFLDEDNISVEK